MFWTGFFIGFAACLAVGLTAYFIHDRRQRWAFITSLSPEERKKLRGFEKVSGDWHEYRELLHHELKVGMIRPGDPKQREARLSRRR